MTEQADQVDVDAPEFARLLASSRRSLERNGGSLEGSVGLESPTEAERRLVIGITGSYRGPEVGRLTVPLTAVDRFLLSRNGIGLVETLCETGGAVVDRIGQRATERAAREALLARVRSSALSGSPWFDDWLTRLLGDGTVTRLARKGQEDLLVTAVRVLERLPLVAKPLPVLAEELTGDTKALSSGTTLSTIVLRAVASWSGLPPPRDREDRARLWESVGVVLDDLASQVLVLNLRAQGDHLARWLTDAASIAEPFRITLRQLVSAKLCVTGTRLYVCENPAVLRSAAEVLGVTAAPLVCTEGVPSAALHKLLESLAPDTMPLWRNDFDWAGLRMTAAAVRRHGAVPWRMGVSDYNAALRPDAEPLVGAPAASPWDPALASSMARTGRSIMEERLLDQLLDDLSH